MNSIYTHIILEHNQSRHNKRHLEGATSRERGHNPNCGDDLTLEVVLEDDHIKDAAYHGSGCAISQASMSIMIDMVKGLTIEEAKDRIDLFFQLLHGASLTEDQMDLLEDAMAFEDLHRMPARVKCGSLGWHCLQVSLQEKRDLL